MARVDHWSTEKWEVHLISETQVSLLKVGHTLTARLLLFRIFLFTIKVWLNIKILVSWNHIYNVNLISFCPYHMKISKERVESQQVLGGNQRDELYWWSLAVMDMRECLCVCVCVLFDVYIRYFFQWVSVFFLPGQIKKY